MPRCSRCGSDAEMLYRVRYMRRILCQGCFTEFYERKVRNTVLKHGMLQGAEKIGIAVSGGKDSMALLRAFPRIFPQQEVTVLHINLGIPGYSDECERVVRKLCDELSVECTVYNLREMEGYGVPDLLKTPMRRRICGACGTVKRHILNRLAYEYGLDRIATGHNLDDTVELLFEFYLKGSVDELVRIRPVAWSNHPKMAHRIKPLIEMTDEEDLYYVLATGTSYAEVECPLVKGSRMLDRKRLILLIEEKIPGFRHTFYKSHVKRILPRLEHSTEPLTLRECEVCGMPSSGKICSYCKMISRLERVVADG